MNLHMPQDPESEAELRYLAAVPNNIVSPANNKPIIGIFQDSLLGSYQFTRPHVTFNPREAMNLLMLFHRVNEPALNSILKEKGGRITNYDILTQIMPPLSMKYKYNDNDFLEIKNGKYIQGQLNKSILGDATKGLLHRVCNDYSNRASANFIDDLQNIITEYMKKSSFSVGVSDLVISRGQKEKIKSAIYKKEVDVKNVLDQVRIGVFDNDTGRSNLNEFEIRVKNIASQAKGDAEKIGRESLKPDNRFVTMMEAGSKGDKLNITFMVACLGQQEVDGKRIPYGFDNRTLPHFQKFDDGLVARGFVERSFIEGLSPQELFFHAMGGRVGLIDTAVKTSTTGYIQRKLVKALEDIMVNYDMTVRNNKNKIVQFAYGEDSIDTTKVEYQQVPIVSMSVSEIYDHFCFPPNNDKSLKNVFNKDTMRKFKEDRDALNEKSKEQSQKLLTLRNEIIKNVFGNKDESSVSCPVAFNHIINNIQGQTYIVEEGCFVDITPLEVYKLLDMTYNNLLKIVYARPTTLFEVLFYYNLSPKELLLKRRFNRQSIVMLLEAITIQYKKSIVAPGEMVGIIAGQSIGEVSTQMTLNTFHLAGVSSKSSGGVPRIEEILSLTANPKSPSLTIYLKDEDQTNKTKAQSIMYMIEHTKLEEVVQSMQICFDPNDNFVEEDRELIEQFKMFEELLNKANNPDNEDTLGDEGDDEAMELSQENSAGTDSGQNNSNNNSTKSKWILRLTMNPEVMLEKNITMDDINFTLKTTYGDKVQTTFSDYNSDRLVFRIHLSDIISQQKNNPRVVDQLDQLDEIYVLKSFQDKMLSSVILRGVSGIEKVSLRKVKDHVFQDPKTDKFAKKDIWVLDTMGTNLLEVLSLDFIDPSKTLSNDIVEVYNVLGIEAARQTILNELIDVVSVTTKLTYHNFSVLCDRMTHGSKLIAVSRFGVKGDDIGPLAKASFEETPEMFLKAARHGELDIMRGVSANVMCGQEGYFGTNLFQVVLDVDAYVSQMHQQSYKPEIAIEDDNKMIRSFMNNEPLVTNVCSTETLTIHNNIDFMQQHTGTKRAHVEDEDNYDLDI